ncbi:MAG: hypothetical protein QM648_05020 [Solirubrobacterales bacterium]
METAPTATIASAKGTCKTKGGLKLKLKSSSAAKKAIAKSKKSISGSLVVTFAPKGGIAPTTKTVKTKIS